MATPAAAGADSIRGEDGRAAAAGRDRASGRCPRPFTGYAWGMGKLGLLVACVVMPFLPGCTCAPDHGDAVDGCVESEREGVNVGTPGAETVTGPLVDDADFQASTPMCGEQAHSFTVDGGEALGRVRFSWEREGSDLEVALAGEQVTVEQVQTNFWARGASFVVHDDEGLALAVNGANSLNQVDDTTIEYGGFRALSLHPCGTITTTGVRVSTASVDRDLSTGEPATLTVGDSDVLFHPFVAYTLGADWHCTDSSDTLNWALVRVAP